MVNNLNKQNSCYIDTYIQFCAMFSALKRLTSKNASEPSSNEVRPGLQTLSTTLQKKFARGVQYNMKIIIKGDRSVGKTCLFLRLQGHKFKEEYVPSDEISVACIQWSYKATDDVVKVEVWDVVDKGRKRKPIDGLKLANAGESIEEGPALDAEFLDVYKGTNGVIIVMDITKAWTFEYVQRELPKVPTNIPVLILANHCDMNHHRTVTADHVVFYIESLQRQAPIRYTEGSMRNGFGLRYLHKFLNVPFLQLQRETLLAQLVTNEHETDLTLQELDLFQEKDEACYDKFLENLTSKRRQVAESTGVVGVPQPVNTQPVEVMKKSVSVPAQISLNITKQPEIVAATEALNLNSDLGMAKGGANSSIVSVEEFVPDGGGLDHSFLDDPPTTSTPVPQRFEQDSDSEPETENPLVAGFQDDIDPADLAQMSAIKIKESPASSVSSIDDLTSPAKESVLSDWLVPDNTRRSSPEGREEVSDLNSSMEPSLESSANKIKKPKKEKSSTDKKKSKEKKKKKVRKERDELEDFLNGPATSPTDDAYEAL